MRAAIPVVTAVVATLTAGCASATPRVDPYTFRAEAAFAHASAPRGFAKADGRPGATFAEGDPVGFGGGKMEVTGAKGWRAELEARVTPDDDVRASYSNFDDFKGHDRWDRTRRFAGERFGLAQHIHGSLIWDSASLSAGHRVASLRSCCAPTDVVVRGGVQRDAFRVSLADHDGPRADRSLTSVAPFVGLETRTGLTDSTTLVLSGDGGRWNHDGRKLTNSDVGIGIRQRLVGPVEASFSYALVRRNAAVRRGSGDNEIDLTAHVFTVGLGLNF